MHLLFILCPLTCRALVRSLTNHMKDVVAARGLAWCFNGARDATDLRTALEVLEFLALLTSRSALQHNTEAAAPLWFTSHPVGRCLAKLRNQDTLHADILPGGEIAEEDSTGAVDPAVPGLAAGGAPPPEDDDEEEDEEAPYRQSHCRPGETILLVLAASPESQNWAVVVRRADGTARTRVYIGGRRQTTLPAVTHGRAQHWSNPVHLPDKGVYFTYLLDRFGMWGSIGR